MRPRRTRLGWNAGLDRANRCPRPEPDADRILRAVQLRADVVTERIVARDLDDAERTVVHPERRDGRVDVVVLGEHREATHVAIGVDLRNFAPGHPAEDVEVMDREVPEQPTRLRDIGLVWRLGVVADQVEVVERAELAAGEHPARLSVARIEPPLEADLERDPGLADTAHDVDGRGEILGERLLAECREAAVGGCADQVRMGARRCRDDDGVGLVQCGLQRRNGSRIDLRGRLRGTIGQGVRDHQLIDPGRRR